MRKHVIWIVFLLTVVTAYAQATPEYSAFYRSTTADPDSANLVTEIGLFNNGSAATESAQVTLAVLGEATPFATDTVPPLAQSEPYTLNLAYPPQALGETATAGQFVTLELVITSNEFAPVRRLIEFEVPQMPAPVNTPAPTPEAPPTETPVTADAGWLTTARAQVESWLSLLPFTVDLDDPVHAGALTVAVLFVILMVWLFLVVVRLMFKRPASFPSAPPPYAAMPPLDPNSIGGRRQLWQNVTHHGSMLAEPIEGNLHGRKLLFGMDNVRYSGWEVVGLRASQYDNYGRVARSQAIAEKKRLHTLNRTLRNVNTLTPEQAQRRVKGTAHWLANRLSRRIQARTASLAIALDIKFRGAHGEVMIVFELYQHQQGAWRRLDSWQPDMTVMGRSIYETYTYTIHGQRPDESRRAFRQRLRDDVTYLLSEMVMCTPPQDPREVATSFAPQSNPDPTPPTREHDAMPPMGETASNRPIPPESMDTIKREPPRR